jgi:hypothetical protein
MVPRLSTARLKPLVFSTPLSTSSLVVSHPCFSGNSRIQGTFQTDLLLDQPSVRALGPFVTNAALRTFRHEGRMPPVFVRIVSEWKNEMFELGYGSEDALFPDHQLLTVPSRPFDPRTVAAMKSTHAVSTAFKLASSLIGKSFSPHSAKHCIGQPSWIFCRTAEQRQAWSANMGHDDENITLSYYSILRVLRKPNLFG